VEEKTKIGIHTAMLNSFLTKVPKTNDLEKRFSLTHVARKIGYLPAEN
jgi:hypothetical protein